MPIENQIRREDIAYKLAKTLELRGQNTPVLSLDNVVVPVVLCENISEGNEQDYAIHRWARGRGSTPAGAAFGKLSFNNQTGSGVNMKVYQIDVFHSGIQTGAPLLHPSGLYAGGIIGITVETASTGGTAINFTKDFLDGRLSKNLPGTTARFPTMDIRFDNSGGLSGHFLRPFVPVTGFHVNLGGLILVPGTRLHFEALDNDCEYNASVEWTESNV
jgi:hypothetical protein